MPHGCGSAAGPSGVSGMDRVGACVGIHGRVVIGTVTTNDHWLRRKRQKVRRSGPGRQDLRNSRRQKHHSDPQRLRDWIRDRPSLIIDAHLFYKSGASNNLAELLRSDANGVPLQAPCKQRKIARCVVNRCRYNASPVLLSSDGVERCNNSCYFHRTVSGGVR